MTATGYEAYESAGELLRALSAPIRVAIVAELGLGQRGTDRAALLGVALSGGFSTHCLTTSLAWLTASATM